MYQILIADDDRHIRERLRNRIDWDGLDLYLCGEAADGNETLALFEQYLPSIVIIDINMPNQNGLEVAQEILNYDSETIIICITGFNDFDYAQSAIKLGVYDFLTKPLDMDDIKAVLRKSIARLDSIWEARQNIEKLNELAKESLPILRRTFLQGLLDSVYTDENKIIDRLKHLQLDIQSSFYAVAIIAPRLMSFSQDQIDLKLMALSQTSLELIQAAGFKCLSLFDSLNNTIALVSWNNPKSAQKIDEIFSNIRNKLLFYFNLDIYIGIGSVVSQLTEIGISTADARDALDYRHLFAQNNIVNIKNVIRVFNKTHTNYSVDKSFIIACFKDRNMAKLTDRLNNLVSNVAASASGNTDKLKRIFIELTVLVSHMAADVGVFSDTIHNLSDPYLHIWSMERVDEMINWFLNLCQNLIDAIEDKKGKQTNRIISIARDYINENYANVNLSLDSISDHVELSPVYFCQLFHSETGVKLTAYINHVRIEQAKLLLKNTLMKIYEIAESTGYSNPKYFNYIFKKQTGLSPKEFRLSDGSCDLQSNM